MYDMLVQAPAERWPIERLPWRRRRDRVALRAPYRNRTPLSPGRREPGHDPASGRPTEPTMAGIHACGGDGDRSAPGGATTYEARHVQLALRLPHDAAAVRRD